MPNTLPIPIDIPNGQGLASYIQAVNAAPILSAEQERDLAVRYGEQNDLDAARELVMSQLRQVVRVARGFTGYGLPLGDLIQEGNIGLMKAVKNFDPKRGVRLISFAVHWIKAEIYDYVLRNWRIVKMATTKAQRKLFFNLRKSKTRLDWLKENEIEQISENLDVPTHTIREMEARMSGMDVAFDGNDAEDEYAAPASYLPDLQYNPEHLVSMADEEQSRNVQLQQAMEMLDPRSQDIVRRRWLDEQKPTLHELAAEYDVSAERIRQIEKRAMEKMKEQLDAA